MKLINKTILYYLLMSLPLLAIAGGISYFLILKEVRESTDESLWKEKLNTEKIIRSFSVSQNLILSYDSLSSVEVIDVAHSGFYFSDTVIFDKYENENIRYRILYSYLHTKTGNYKIKILRSALENEDMIEGLLTILLLVLAFLVISFFIANLIFSKILWKPFYKTIRKLNNYDIKKNEEIELVGSGTNEFKILNEAISSLTNKINSDYKNLKEFTENASHEIQTPLAVIKSKLELLIQSENLKEHEMIQIQAIDDSVNKLSSLNKALLLLTKIENNQFQDADKISIQSVIEKQLNNLQYFIEEKNLTVNVNFVNDYHPTMNVILCDILFLNLIKNSVWHNIENGSINILLNSKKLIIENTGIELHNNPVDMFDRFKKSDTSIESLGLGLSIVKSISERYSFNINYKYENEIHSVTIIFN